MAGALSHAPCEIIRQLLIDLGYGVIPADRATWPIYATNEPHKPDNCITVFDAIGRDEGRIMINGKRVEYEGIQIRIRSATYNVGYVKADNVAKGLDTMTVDQTVTVGATNYLVHAVHRTTSILAIGSAPNSQRELFTINAITTLKQI